MVTLINVTEKFFNFVHFWFTRNVTEHFYNDRFIGNYP